jgi:hypothetical protein
LNFAAQGHSKGLNGLVISVHDNIKRVVEFMIQQGILVEGGGSSPESETGKIWNKSWDSIGAFFQEMKTQVVGGTNGGSTAATVISSNEVIVTSAAESVKKDPPA